MNNQIANFNVSPDTITTATCEEANCEAGNPGDFVRCSGSNRRRMNIVSDIPRPAEEHCQIIESFDQPSTEDVKYWGPFPSRKHAIAHRIGLIRAGKCQGQ